MNEEENFYPEGPTLDDLLALRRQSAEEAYLRKDQENRRLEEYARIQGYEPPPEKGPALVPTIFDTIDTPRQAVAGVLAGILGMPGYEGDFIENSAKGRKENVTTGDILEGIGVYPTAQKFVDMVPGWKGAYQGAKWVTNFVGDVVTDPLAYLTGGASTFAKVGGKALSKVGLETIDAFRAAERARRAAEHTPEIERTLAEAIQNLPGKAPKKTGFDALADETKALIDSDISAEIGKKIQAASALVKQSKKNKAIQASQKTGALNEADLADKLSLDLAANKDQAMKELKLLDDLGIGQAKGEDILNGNFGLDARDAYLKGSLNLGPDVKLEDLFAKPAIGFRPPWAGFKGVAHEDGILPIARANSTTIPGITAASSKVYDLLDGKLYSADLKVGSYMRDLERDLIERGGKEGNDVAVALGNVLRFANEAAVLARKAPSLFSRSFLARDRGVASETRQYHIARQAAVDKASSVADEAFAGVPDDVLNEMSGPFQAALKQLAPVKDKSGKLTYPAEYDPEVFDKARQQMVSLVSATHGPEVAAATDRGILRAVKIFDEIDDEATKLKILASSREGYLPGRYRNRKNTEGIGFAPSSKSAAGTLIPGSSLAKTYATMGAAAAEGLDPVRNLKDLVRYRQLAHENAKAALDYYDRFRFNYGYSPEMRDRLKEIMSRKASEISGYAAKYAKERGLTLDADKDIFDIQKDLYMSEASKIGYAKGLLDSKRKGGGPIVMSKGHWLTPDQLGAWEDLSIQAPEEAKKIADKLRLPYYDFTDKGFTATPQIRFSDDFKKDVAFLTALAEERKKLLPGRLGETITTRAGADFAPRPIEQMVRREFEGMPEVQDVVEHYSNLLPKPVVDSINDALDTSGYLDDLIKKEGPLSAQLKSVRSGLLGYLRWHKIATTQPFPGYWFQNIGSIPALGLQAIGTIGAALSPLRLLKHLDIAEGKTIGRSASGEYISKAALDREIRQFGLPVSPGAKEEVKDVLDAMAASFHSFDPRRDKAAKEINNIFTRSRDAVFDFSSRIENMGRRWTYVNLRMEGMDPASAIEATARAFTDYAAGKTKFERNFLNNLFFFYSFARAQTANTLVNLVTNPGVIGTQIHMFDATAQLFKDYGDPPLPPDIDEKVKSLRTYDSLSRYVGRNKEGLPEFMTSVGLPMEQVSKWFNFTTPQNWGSLHQWLETSGDNARNIFRNQVAALNPLVGKVFEIATGRNWFFDRPITDESLRKVADPETLRGLAQVVQYPYRAVPEAIIHTLNDFTQNALKGKNNGDGTYTVSPYGLALLTMLVPGAGRATQTLTYLARQDQDTASKVTRFLSGIRISPQDVDKSIVHGRNEQLKHFFDVEGLKQSKAKIKQRQIGEEIARNRRNVDQDEELPEGKPVLAKS